MTLLTASQPFQPAGSARRRGTPRRPQIIMSAMPNQRLEAPPPPPLPEPEDELLELEDDELLEELDEEELEELEELLLEDELLDEDELDEPVGKDCTHLRFSPPLGVPAILIVVAL